MRLAALLLLTGCVAEFEGDDAGECSDGADNDRNTYFDCEDHGCTGSPDCAGLPGPSDPGPTTDPPPPTTDPTGPGTTTPTGGTTSVSLADYQSYTVSMEVNWSFPTQAFPDCTLWYEGSGEVVEATTSRITFTGPYTRAKTTCTEHALLESSFPWYDKATGEALVSFKFTNGLSIMDEWYADPTEMLQGGRAEWWMFDMAEPYEPYLQFLQHSEGYVDPLGYFVVQYDVEVTFSE